jgi:hypothetical protein
MKLFHFDHKRITINTRNDFVVVRLVVNLNTEQPFNIYQIYDINKRYNNFDFVDENLSEQDIERIINRNEPNTIFPVYWTMQHSNKQDHYRTALYSTFDETLSFDMIVGGASVLLPNPTHRLWYAREKDTLVHNPAYYNRQLSERWAV